MLYTKYAIEIVNSVDVIFDNKMIPILTYENSFRYEIHKDIKYVNIIKYLDKCGIVSDYMDYFYTYEDAYIHLDKNIFNIKHNTTNIISIKIVEILDDIPLPILEMRKIKLKKLLCSEKK